MPLFAAAALAVPEPAAWALTIVGVALVGTALRRQRSDGGAAPSLTALHGAKPRRMR